MVWTSLWRGDERRYVLGALNKGYIIERFCPLESVLFFLDSDLEEEYHFVCGHGRGVLRGY